MLKLYIPGCEVYDETTNCFSEFKGGELLLEHSLLSIFRWEAKYHKSFLSKGMSTPKEVIDYIRCMTINKGVEDIVYYSLTDDNIKDVKNYIENPMSATTFSKRSNEPRSRDIITAEIIYYKMFSYGIPKECEKWHLNQLLTLIRVFDIKNSPEKKMSKKELQEQTRALNAARRAKYNTRG